MEQTDVSVIVPVFNAQLTIKRSLKSIVSQTLKNIEIICVDDGSTDSSVAIIQDFANFDSRVRLISQENSHAGVARNNGIDHATGKYIAFLDADDVYYSDNTLEKLFHCAELGQADMVRGTFVYVRKTDGTRYTDGFSMNSSVSWHIRRSPNFRRYPERFIHAADVPWNGLYDRQFLLNNRIRFNDLVCVNDHSFYIDCLLRSGKIVFVNDPVVLYTVCQEGSLVAEKHKHLSAQIKSYNIVRDMCLSEPAKIKNAVMRQELAGVFGLYDRIGKQAQEDDRRIFCEFLNALDPNDVGADYLEHFEYAEQYHKIRYGTAFSRKNYPMVKKITIFLKEQGLKNTWSFVMDRLNFRAGR